MSLPLAPSACTFDTRGLFTHGEFRCFQSPNPCLNLYTHGEFPRALFREEGGAVAAPAVGTGGRSRVYKTKVIPRCPDDEAIILALALADDDDDDWW